MTGCADCKNLDHLCPHNNFPPEQSKVIALFPKKDSEHRSHFLGCANKPQDLESAAFMRFVKELGLPQMFASLPDPREASKIIYPLSSLCLWSFYTCAFRQGSKNAMQTTLESIEDPHKETIRHLLGIEDVSRVPHSSVVDDAISRIEFVQFNDILFQLFDRIVSRKVFYHHQEILLPYNTFQIGVDGYWVHHYTHPHSVDAQGHNNCPYCLPRAHNKGKPHEVTSWVHVVVTFVLICGEGVTLPLYIYPLKANQVQETERV